LGLKRVYLIKHQLIFGEREREERAGSYFGMRERNEEEAYLGSCVAV